MIERQEERVREQRRRFAHLFADAYLDIGALKSIAIEERAILTGIIDSCLANVGREAQALDGSTIVLLNPDEQRYAFLRAPDGVLLLPRYRLQRLEPAMATAGSMGG
jgi:hypothetical protein